MYLVTLSLALIVAGSPSHSDEADHQKNSFGQNINDKKTSEFGAAFNDNGLSANKKFDPAINDENPTTEALPVEAVFRDADNLGGEPVQDSFQSLPSQDDTLQFEGDQLDSADDILDSPKDLLDDARPERRSLLHETDDYVEAEVGSASEEDFPRPPVHDLESAKAESAWLRGRLEALRVRNEEISEDLEYYVKRESFLYKCLGGPMIEFVCSFLLLVFILKVCDILLMVTDILEEVVIPLLRTGPVVAMQSKREAGILF